MLKEISLESAELECSVLCCAFWGEEQAAKAVSKLVDKDFKNPIRRVIFQAVSGLLLTGDKIDLSSVAASLNKAGQYTVQVRDTLIEIANYLSTSALIDQYIEEMLEIRYRQQTLEFSKNIQKAAKEQPNIKKLQEVVSDMPIIGFDDRDPTTGQIMQDTVDRIASRLNNPESSLPGNATGFDKLDKTTGGIKDGELIILTAEPNVGKSLLAFQTCINNAKDNKHSVYFNYEMNEKQIGDRALAIALPFEIDKIKYPREHLTDADLVRLADNDVQHKLDKYLHIYSNTGRTLANIKSRCIELSVRGNKPRLIVIDYLQLMHGTGQTEREKLENLSKGLKDIAMDFECPLIAIASLSKDGTTRGSKQIDYDADQMWHLSREHKSENKATRALTTLAINKNRDGGKGVVNLMFIEKYLSFRPVVSEGSI